MILMSRALKMLAVLTLVVVLPTRAVAGVTIGFCASGHKDMAVPAGHAGHGVGATGHGSHSAPADEQPFNESCSICAEHCSSAAFAPSSGAAVSMRPSGSTPALFAERNAPPFVPDQPDRPPLA